MKAHPDDQHRLLELQTADTALSRLSHTARSLPERQAAQDLHGELEAVQRRLGAAEGELEDARADLRRIENDVEMVEKRRARDEERLRTSSSAKDAAGLESELASLHRRRSDLEDIELELMERVETLEASYGALREEREQLAGRLAEAERARDDKLSALRAERDGQAERRAALAGSLPQDLLALYERQRERHGVGAALLQGGVSLGSNVRLDASELDRIRKASPDEVVLCPDSQAILVRTDESGL